MSNGGKSYPPLLRILFDRSHFSFPLASPQVAHPSPTYDPMTHGGCTLNFDESDTFPFCHRPFLYQFKGETHCSMTVELPNCVEDIRMSVLKTR